MATSHKNPREDPSFEDSLFESPSALDGAAPLRRLRPSTSAPDSSPSPSITAPGTVLCATHCEVTLTAPVKAGGMGQVWKGTITKILPDPVHFQTQFRHLQTGTPVAAKLVAPAIGDIIPPALLIRQELAGLLAVRSSHIVPIIDWNTTDYAPCLIFPLMTHGTLQDEMDHSENPPTLDELLHLGQQILQGLTDAHRACLLHLDLKPGNIFRDGQGGYLLGDFGLASRFQAGSLSQIPGLGTPFYQAPEQAQAQLDAFDQRTDLFALGMTLYRRATNLNATQWACLRNNHQTTPQALPPLQTFRPDLPTGFCQLIHHLIQNQRSQRPGGSMEVLQRFQVMGHLGDNSASTESSFPGEFLSPDQYQAAIDGMVDEVWRSLLSQKPAGSIPLQLQPGEILFEQNQTDYRAYLLIKGVIGAYAQNQLLAEENREGEVLGASGALLGTPRITTLKAHTQTIVLALSPSDFEAFVIANPMVTMRLLKILCEHLAYLTNPETRSHLNKSPKPTL